MLMSLRHVRRVCHGPIFDVQSTLCLGCCCLKRACGMCRAFHISEDVFAGYNATLRGARTKFLEYISVGKGRDMGFDSINSFESKASRALVRLRSPCFFKLVGAGQISPDWTNNITGNCCVKRCGPRRSSASLWI